MTGQNKSIPLFSIVSAGFVSGIISIFAVSSFATMIFAGPLAPFVPRGIGIALLSATVIGIIMSLTSSYPGTIGLPQDKTSAIFALIAATITASLPPDATGETIFATVIVAIAIASFLTGALFLILGLFRLGTFIRFVPYPVIGGFMAGSGWLLIYGALNIMAPETLSLATVATLTEPNAFYLSISSIIFGVFLLLVIRYTGAFLLFPVMLLGGVALFYLALFAFGFTFDQASESGWLLGPFPEGGLFDPVTPAIFAQANWSSIFETLSGIGTIFIISVLSLLLHASAIELSSRRDVDFDAELRSAGYANLVVSTLGGMAGFHGLALSILTHKMNAAHRATGLIAASMCGIALFAGAEALSYFPKPVAGGLLLFLGLGFIVEWTIDARKKLPRPDYLVVILILVVIAFFGYLEGIAVGLFTGLILFVVNYSQIDIVRHILSGSDYRSNLARPARRRELLGVEGDRIMILKLQGYIFFGTSSRLLNSVRSRALDPERKPLSFIVLDFHLVSDLDSSSVMSFTRMSQFAESQNFVIVFVNMQSKIRTQFETGGFSLADRPSFGLFVDLDHGLEWCENEILRMLDSDFDATDEKLPERLRREFSQTVDINRVLGYMEKLETKEGHRLMERGDDSDDLYFIESGQVTVFLDMGGGKNVRLQTMEAGAVIGEMGLYLSGPRTASVVTDKPSVLYKITRQSIARMEKEYPEAALLFHQFLARLISEKLSDTNRMLKAVLE